jgi:hypothetical protein
MLVRCLAAVPLLAVPLLVSNGQSNYFVPTHQLSGIGVARAELTPVTLAARTQNMIEAETFAIMREPSALAGAERICSPALQKLFRKAALESGVPASLIGAMAYLESWGDANAESPAGPKGIMQFSESTARAAGLQVVYATRYKTTRTKQLVQRKDKPAVYRTVTTRTAYAVKIRDDRFVPDRAVMAAGRYLARLDDKFDGLDWAVFGYHCGEGCIQELMPLAEDALGRKPQPSVAAMFFAANPARHRDLYEAIERHMQRDYSPTYWFRIKRAEQLLDLYRANPRQFQRLIDDYRNPHNPERRANDRLMAWLKPSDVLFQNGDDLRRAKGRELARAFDKPEYFGFSTSAMVNRDPLYLGASPAAIGTLAYIAFETRRLFDAMKPRDERFAPLEVSALVSTAAEARDSAGLGDADPIAHSTGQVFDLNLTNLPRGEREALDFVLDDLGWDGYLGFVQSAGESMHIGCSPTSRDFFAQVYDDAFKSIH